jgi:rod shape-determining protein MreD
MLWALIGGLIIDLFSGAPFGVCTLPLLVVGFLSGLGEKNVFRFHVVIPLLVVPLASLLYGIGVWALLRVLGWPAAWGQSLSEVIFPGALVNTLAMPIVYFALRVLDRRRREEIAW